MLKVSGTAADVKVKIFSGDPAKVEGDITGFLNEKKLRIHGFAQSQSTTTANEVIVTATVLYSEFDGTREEKIGFNR